jgi:hypothetical protein
VVVVNPNFTVYWDGQGGTFIRDGVQTGPLQPTQLGGLFDGSEVWDGALADVAFYDAALTGAQVSNDYQAMLGGSASVPVSINVVLSGNNMVLSWPQASAGDWTLQSSPSLSPASWTSLGTNTPVTIPTTNQSQFFRLEKN